MSVISKVANDPQTDSVFEQYIKLLGTLAIRTPVNMRKDNFEIAVAHDALHFTPDDVDDPMIKHCLGNICFLKDSAPYFAPLLAKLEESAISDL